MLHKFILGFFTPTIVVIALNKHYPEVYENVEETSAEIIRKTRQPNAKYQPYVFVFNKAVQPDLRKWRYFQQQQIDSKNMAKIRERLELINVFRNGRPQDQSTLETAPPSVKIALESRWKVIYPKHTENENTFSPSELIKMQDQYGQRERPRVRAPLTRSLNYNNKGLKENISNGTNKNDQYMVNEDDLETEASEIEESKVPIDRQDQISVVLPTNLIPNSHVVYIDSTDGGTSVIKDNNPENLNILTYDKINQKDINALNSLLGNTPAAQLNGLKQFLHSQSAQVMPTTNLVPHITNIPDNDQMDLESPQAIQNSFNQQNTDDVPSQLVQKTILQSKGQTLDQLQAQLNIISQKEGEKAIADAQQKSLEYVNSQRKAIELAELEGREVALAAIKAHNFQPPQPESLPLVSPKEEEFTGTTEISNLVQNHQQVGIDDTAINKNNAENILTYPQIQAQAYLHLISQNHSSQEQPVDILKYIDVQPQNVYPYVYPEVNHNGLSGLNNPHSTIQFNNEVHAQLQAQAYKKLAAEAYSRPVEDLQKYVNSEDMHVQEQSVYQGEHDVSSSSKMFLKYSVKTRLRRNKNSTSSPNKHNMRIKRQTNNTETTVLDSDCDYIVIDFDNSTALNNTYSELVADNPVAEKLVYSRRKHYYVGDDEAGHGNSDDDNVDYDNGDDDDGDSNETGRKFRFVNKNSNNRQIFKHRRRTHFKIHVPKFYHHRKHHHSYLKKPDISLTDNSLNSVKSILPSKHGDNPTIIIINNSNGHNGNDSKHKRKHRTISKRPTFRKRNYPKIDRKIRKALNNVLKLESRYLK